MEAPLSFDGGRVGRPGVMSRFANTSDNSESYTPGLNAASRTPTLSAFTSSATPVSLEPPSQVLSLHSSRSAHAGTIRGVTAVCVCVLE